MPGISPVPSFPAYSGPYPVGTADIEVPVSELCPTTPSPNTKVNTISARIFYPCESPTRTSSKAYWYPNPQSEYLSAYLRFLGTSSRLARFLALFPRTLYYISLPAHENANILAPPTSSQRWPTMIFSHGLGGTRNMYSHICGSIASHGVVVIAPEHRDGSTPIAFIRDESGEIIHTVQYQQISHENTNETQAARRTQLMQRLWEICETYSLALRLDKGTVLSNYAAAKERASSDSLDLSLFRDKLDVQRPGSVSFAGHSFGAVTALQFLKTVYYGREGAPTGYQSLYTPPRDSSIARQITVNTKLVLLDCWMMPTLDSATAWLHDRPLPAYKSGGPGGKAILAVLSESFYRWNNNWKEQRRALSPDPSVDPDSWTEERLNQATAPWIFYPAKSAHLSQSDFGVLFPWLTRKMFKAEDPERTIKLNTRAILEVLRNNGAEVAKTSNEDMEVVGGTGSGEQVHDSKPLVSRKSSEDTLTDGDTACRQDEAILIRDDGVRGWISLGLGAYRASDD